MKETAINILQQIGDTLTACEAKRDYEGLSKKDEQFYLTLAFCYDLLSHIDFNKETIHEIPEAAGYEGENTEFNPHPVPADYFPEFVFALATRSGTVDLRKILKRFMSSQKEAAKICGKREATISDYINHKSPFNCDNYEQILNAYIQGVL